MKYESSVWCLRWKGSLAQALAAAGGPRGGVFRAAPTAAAGGGSSLTQDFHTRLDNLLRTLVHARPHFVRCLRANLAEQPMLFERPAVAKQVRPACCRTVRPGSDGAALVFYHRTVTERALVGIRIAEDCAMRTRNIDGMRTS